ncbi:MAG: outer membrane beta-barrel protein [Pseudomonadota bacterium]
MNQPFADIAPPCPRPARAGSYTRALPALAGLGLALALGLAAPAPAPAGTMFKPTVSVGVGYDTNVRLTREPVADNFVTAKVGAVLETGPSTNQLRLRGNLEARQYVRRTDLNRDLETASLAGEWSYSPSPRWRYVVSENFTSTYDPVQLSETGQLLRVRQDSGRQDSNSLSLRVTHQYSERSSFYAVASHQMNQGNTDEIEKSQYFRGEFGLSHALGVNYRVDASTNWSRDDFERTPDTDRQTVDLRLVRMFSKKEEVFLRGSTTIVRSLSEDSLVRQARDYETYTGQVGYKNAFSPALTLEAAAGWSMVEGDPTFNSASGQGYPALDVTLRYLQSAWSASLYGRMTLNEYSAEGQNSGLTDSRRIGANLDYKLSQLLTFNAYVDFVHDDFKQDSQAAQTATTGNVESYRAGASFTYHFTRDVFMMLDYRFLERNAEVDSDDRDQNLVTLTINSDWPRRW